MNKSSYIMQYLIYTLIGDVCLSAENVQKLLTQFCAVCNMTAIHRRHICALCFFLFIHQAANNPIKGILLSWHSIHNHFSSTSSILYHLNFWPFSNLGRSCAGVDCAILGEADACPNECQNGKAKGLEFLKFCL